MKSQNFFQSFTKKFEHVSKKILKSKKFSSNTGQKTLKLSVNTSNSWCIMTLQTKQRA